MVETEPNYCHDRELRTIAALLGVKNPVVINNALSLGEGPYTGFDRAEEFLLRQREQAKLNRRRQVKIALSAKQKREILGRYGIED